MSDKPIYPAPPEENDSKKKLGPVDDAFDLTGMLLDFMANWKWFLLCVVACLICAYFHIATIVPTYQVNASLYLNNTNTNSSSRAASLDASAQLVATKNYIDQTELEILKSHNNVIDIVDSLKMAYSYWRVGNFRDIPLYGDNAIQASLDSVSLANLNSAITLKISNSKKDGLFDIVAENYVGGEKQERKYDDVELPMEIELAQGTVTLSRVSHIPTLIGTEKIVILNPHRVASGLSGSLNLHFDEFAPYIVRIAYYTNTPRQGVDVINALIDFYNRHIIEEQNRSAIQTEAFILERLVNINDELRDVEQRLQDYRQAHNIANLDQQVSSSLAAKNSSEARLAEIDAELQMVQTIENEVNRADVYSTLPSATANDALNSVIEAYNKRVTQLNRVLESSTPDNPVVTRIQEELTRDKTRILQNIASVKNNIAVRRSTVAALEGKSAGTLSSLPPIDKGLQEIFREQQVKVNIYTFLLQRREEIALQKSLATPTARLIDNPVGSGPVSPNRNSIYMMAFVIGLAIPAAIIFCKRFFFSVYKDQEELQRMTNVPIIGEISADTAKEAKPIVVGANVSTPIAELFRLLRNNIGFTRNGIDKKVILVTSSVSGEGKTFVSTNLAMTYALTGKKVVVVGFDIRRPALAHKFGLSNSQGVTTFLSGQINDIKTITHQSAESENLYIIPAGPIPPNPNELLLSENMVRLMDQLRHDFDIVILDTAPIGVISDTFIIIPYSDIQLYVTRASYSTKTSLKVLHQAVRDNRLSDPYIVLNGVDITSGSYSYRKYGHYYHTGSKTYGYGYSDNSK